MEFFIGMELIKTDTRLLWESTVKSIYKKIEEIDTDTIMTISCEDYPYEYCKTILQIKKNHFDIRSLAITINDPHTFGSNVNIISDEHIYDTINRFIEICVYKELSWKWSVDSQFVNLIIHPLEPSN